MIGWVATLDAYEASLDSHQRLIDEELNDEHNPWPPAELPTEPLPEELSDRASDLVRRSHKIIDDMAAKMANIPPPKPNRHHHHQPTRAPSRWTTTL